MTAIVTRGNAMDLHLPDESVDLVVTSPPYFGLRSYQDGGEHYAGQVGDEATPTDYLDALIACTAEWMRVLKPGGSIFVNLGDKYAGAPSGPRTPMGDGYIRDAEVEFTGPRRRKRHDVPTKSLIGLPWRYAIRCIDDLGLILRAEIVWSKPNGLPESVTDRVRRSHEQVFHFVKQPRYFSAVDEVREASDPNNPRERYARRHIGEIDPRRDDATVKAVQGHSPKWGMNNPLGKLPGSVWTIPTAPLKVPASLGIDHFAAYPPELVRRIVLGWSPREVCTRCGEGRRPVTTVAKREPNDRLSLATRSRTSTARGTHVGSTLGYGAETAERTVTGYACACPDTTAPTTPGVVLDPFGGTGTTALVASCYGRVGISVDLSADYCRLAHWRTTDPGERARVLGVEKPPAPIVGQLGLFEGGAA